MTASTEPPAPIGQLVNTSQRAIYGINRDFRDRSVLRSSRAAEWTTWCSTTRSTLSQHITLTAFATPTPLTLHVPKGCRWWLSSSETPLPMMIQIPVSALCTVLTWDATW